MIPKFDENGNLPPGVHFCDWWSFQERFGYTPKRAKMIQGLEEVMTQLKAAGCCTAYIDGSFVSNKLESEDFDMCWDRDDVDINYLRKNAPLILKMHLSLIF
ncbi:hypothetical protein WA1_27250 [Scytonema hofmannii PCC 7110]|uniref:Uncharacterized protein n=1 Tax=Scytonema hofmannii PCC 7110 TaxID=128403 RepID=A0A139X6E6_9CYAN|nr:hypothetical protein [Scytonema hofmannii]KYC40236.1 hypothetical protein WA1_27250 [Scytonema hofmannii PCC 7110]